QALLEGHSGHVLSLLSFVSGSGAVAAVRLDAGVAAEQSSTGAERSRPGHGLRVIRLTPHRHRSVSQTTRRGSTPEENVVQVTLEALGREKSPVLVLPLLSNNNIRSEEHTSELQSRENLVCRLLLQKQ